MKKAILMRASTISLKLYAKKGDIQNRIASALTTTPTNLGTSEMHYLREVSRKRKMIFLAAATQGKKNPRKKEVRNLEIRVSRKKSGNQEKSSSQNSLESLESQGNHGRPKLSRNLSRRRKMIR